MPEIVRANTRGKPGRFTPAGFVAQSPVFRGLEPEAIGRIVRAARKLHIARGEVVYGRAAGCRHVYLIATGYVALSVHSDSEHEKIVELLGPGACLGVENMLAPPPQSVVATMLTEGVLLAIPHEAVLDALAQSPQLGGALLADLARRTLELVREVETQATQCGIERVAAFLLRISRSASDHPRDVTLPVPKRIVASLLDLTKESFSRVLRELSERELVEVRGRSIHLRDPRALAQVCSRGTDCAPCAGCARGGLWRD